MTLFGHTLDPQQIGSLVFMLTALVLWALAWRGERSWMKGFRQWEADRKARRDAEIAAEGGGSGPSKGGPWG